MRLNTDGIIMLLWSPHQILKQAGGIQGTGRRNPARNHTTS